MKLFKALESGRPFRMRGESALYNHFEGKVTGEGKVSRGLNPQDLDHNDWELEPKEVKVTRTAIETALQGVVTPSQADTILGRLGL
jgi:hypothetical protein